MTRLSEDIDAAVQSVTLRMDRLDADFRRPQEYVFSDLYQNGWSVSDAIYHSKATYYGESGYCVLHFHASATSATNATAIELPATLTPKRIIPFVGLGFDSSGNSIISTEAFITASGGVRFSSYTNFTGAGDSVFGSVTWVARR